MQRIGKNIITVVYLSSYIIVLHRSQFTMTTEIREIRESCIAVDIFFLIKCWQLLK